MELKVRKWPCCCIVTDVIPAFSSLGLVKLSHGSIEFFPDPITLIWSPVSTVDMRVNKPFLKDGVSIYPLKPKSLLTC
jgi:hypothetical protein